MADKLSEVYKIIDQCLGICADLDICLKSEREALVQFRMEALLENNFKKEKLLSSLVRTRQQLRDFLQKQYQVSKFSELGTLLGPEDQKTWLARREQWEKVWGLTRASCRRNQEFIQHSLKNLNQLSEHLKVLFGRQRIYSKEGQTVDFPNQGNVVQAEY